MDADKNRRLNKDEFVNAAQILDVDDPETREIVGTLSTSPREANSEPGQVLLNSPELTKILKALDRPQSRIWILDNEQRVRAVVGGLSTPLEQEPINESELSLFASYFVI